ncbi:MAG: alpha/beta hydrolase [Acutalibacteraceae bacterium]|nr:alpha/beta hydrolase [Acutalibacteraceae bacterium]
MTVNIDGLNIEYITEGEGQPVLLLHGWGSSFGVYRGIINTLKNRCRLFAVNFPGCGGSDTMDTPWSLDDYCHFVLKFMAAVGISDPILIGHSHGGRVILKMAADGMVNPPKIVLLDSAGLIPKKSTKQKLRAKSFKAIKRVLSLPVIKNHSEPLLDKARKHYGSADYNAAPEVLRKTLVSLVNTDLRDIIHNIKCPTLLIWGENDTATPLSDAKIIESLIPDSGLCVIKGTGHYSFCEQPYQAHAILNSFIK